MKLDTQINPVKTNINNKTQFKIAVNAKSFEILSSNIYTNPVKAIVRELSTNAYDSHVSVGKQDVPFEVHIPDQFDSNFKIQDFGTGLTPKDIERNYTEYFFSSRSNSNEHVGCLGLGSKTPFAYTDQFTIISYINGVQYTYVAFLDEDKCPSISFISKVELGAECNNGLFIQFAVKKQDHHKFRTEALEVYRWFKVKPTINISLPSDTTYIWESPNLKIKGKYGSANIIMGNICYSNYNLHNVSINSCDIFVPIGSVDIAANRESLQLTDKTTKYIKEIYDKDIQIFLKEQHSRLNTLTLREASAESALYNVPEFIWQDQCIVNGGSIYSLDKKLGPYGFNRKYRYVPSEYKNSSYHLIKDQNEYLFIKNLGLSIQKYGWTKYTKYNFAKSIWTTANSIKQGYYIVKSGGAYELPGYRSLSPSGSKEILDKFHRYFGEVDLYCIKDIKSIPPNLVNYKDYIISAVSKIDLVSLSEQQNLQKSVYYLSNEIVNHHVFFKNLLSDKLDRYYINFILELASRLGIQYEDSNKKQKQISDRYPMLEHMSYTTDKIYYINFMDYLYEQNPNILEDYANSKSDGAKQTP